MKISQKLKLKRDIGFFMQIVILVVIILISQWLQ